MPGNVSEEHSLSVAILAGGQSRRMGRDKALLPWGGQLMIERMVSIAARVPEACETLIVGDRPEYHGRGARVVPDEFPGAGPLGGIVTALAAACAERALILAVDMPLASPALLSAMARHGTRSAVVVPEVLDPATGATRLQVLHAIYHQECLDPARQCLCQNERRVAALLDAVTVERLDEAWLRQHDPALRSFVNVNDPGEYERASFMREED